jgi:hypothetical protein
LRVERAEALAQSERTGEGLLNGDLLLRLKCTPKVDRRGLDHQSRSHSMIMDAYIRVSRVMGREGDSYMSPAIQEADIRRWAKTNGVTIAETPTIEEDVSGGKAVKDRGLEKLISRIEHGQSGGVLVHHIDRFGRDHRCLDRNQADQGRRRSLRRHQHRHGQQRRRQQDDHQLLLDDRGGLPRPDQAAVGLRQAPQRRGEGDARLRHPALRLPAHGRNRVARSPRGRDAHCQVRRRDRARYVEKP